MLEVEKINLNFGRPVLKDVSLKLKEGEIISIVGRSGAGKTSLLKIISGLLSPDSGAVTFEGQRVKGPHEKLIPGHDEVRLVNQDFSLDDFHTVEENVKLQILHLKSAMRDRFTEELISLMGLEEVKGQQARFLSGGEQQRLAIARVLAKEPKVILLDEPFSHLDAVLRVRLTGYLLELKKIRKTSFILVSHDGAEVLGLSDVIYFMKNGTLTKKGAPEKVYYKYKTLEEGRLFGYVNSVQMNSKRVFFRPDEFVVCDTHLADSMSVVFEGEAFTGVVRESFFKTTRGEKIVLFSFNSMKDVRFIRIQKKIA
jgi:iron(III) transport system ATP-binding protein